MVDGQLLDWQVPPGPQHFLFLLRPPLCAPRCVRVATLAWGVLSGAEISRTGSRASVSPTEPGGHLPPPDPAAIT